LSAPEMERMLALKILPMHNFVNAPAPLLLGGPGIGKSYITLSSFVRLAQMIALTRSDALLIASGGQPTGSLTPPYPLPGSGSAYEAWKDVPVYTPDGQSLTFAELLDRAAGETANEIVRHAGSLAVERLCNCIKEALDRTGGEAVERKIEEVKKVIVEAAKAEADAFAAELAKLDEGIREQYSQYYKEIASDSSVLLKMLSNSDAAALRAYAAFDVAAVKALVAGALKGNTRRFTVILYDSALPVSLYRGSYVYVMKNMGSVSISELVGLPATIGTERGVLSDVVPPKWAVALKEAALGVFNLDEFTNQQMDAIKSASYSLVLNKVAGNYVFAKPVVATGNTVDTSSLVRPLPGPLFTGRLSVYMMSAPTVEDWIEYMDRVHERWPSVVGDFLKLFSVHSSELKKSKARSEIRALVTKLTVPFDDPFYPSPELLKKYSTIRPGRDTSFPSPRAWEGVLVNVQSYLDMYTEKSDSVVREMIHSEFESLGMPIFGQLIADTVIQVYIENRSAGIPGIVDFIRDNLQYSKMVDTVNALLSGKEQSVYNVGRVLFDIVVAISYAKVLLARCRLGDKTVDSQTCSEVDRIVSALQRQSGRLTSTDPASQIVRYLVNSIQVTTNLSHSAIRRALMGRSKWI